MKLKRYVCFLAVLLSALVSGGGCNILYELGNRTSDAAILDDTRNLIDKGLWTDAITKWNTMTANGQADRNAKVVLASAYAGRGGLDIINLITALNNNAGGGANTFFLELMTAFKGGTAANFNDEITAQNTILTISTTAALRTADENVFLAFIEFAKLGTLFASTADPTGTGSVAAGFDQCNHATITDTQAAEAVIGIAIMLNSLAAAGSSIAGSSLGPMTNACTALNAIDPTFCSTTNTGSVTVLQKSIARTLIGEANLGIGLKGPVYAAPNQQYEFILPCPNCNGAGVGVAPGLCP